MKSYSAYLFDVDGTIIDTTELIYQCFRNTFEVFGKKGIDRASVIEHTGLTLRDQLEIYFGPLTDERFKEISAVHMTYQLAVYRNYLKPFAYVNDVLDALLKRGAKLGVVTSRRKDTLSLYLKETGLYEFFSAFVTPEVTDRHKPDPEPAHAALKLLGAEASDSLLVGDSVYDIACGNRAGCETALVPWGTVDGRDPETRPTYVLKDIRELV
jgi:pyrophosphatase PpaX